ncbi:MAG: FkbM family methyltransferase [Saprospiraceae bacterium]
MQIRQRIRNFLESFDLYFKIKYSNFYIKNIQRKHDSTHPILKLEKAYYLSLIKNIKKNKKVIFDVGANEGFISSFFLDENFKVIAIEPDPRNQKILAARFHHKEHFKLIKKGVSDEEKIAPFFIHNRNSSLNTFSSKWKESIESRNIDEGFSAHQKFIELITLDQIIKQRGIPSFIKIDVEGHELEVINGLNVKVPLISFEANLPEFKEETILIINQLEQICEESDFNFSIKYELVFSKFVNRSKLEEELNKINEEVCLEIICRMSNYAQFFN